MRAKLDMQVAAAVGAMLVGRDAITLDEVAAALPAHIRAANPSLKAMARALVTAGWVAERHDGGRIVYAPPGLGGEDEPGEGHNGGDPAGDEVRDLIERAERLIDAKTAAIEDIKDLWTEVKGRGHDVDAMKAIVRLRAKSPEDRHTKEAILEVYLRNLGMMA